MVVECSYGQCSPQKWKCYSTLDEEAKKATWKEHYEQFSNMEYDLESWPSIRGTSSWKWVIEAIDSMKSGKSANSSQIVAEMLKVTGEAGTILIHDLIGSVIQNGRIPSDWEENIIGPQRKRCCSLAR